MPNNSFQTRAGSRLPATTQLPSRGAQIAVGFLALIGTIAVVVGVPILLWSAFGSPWPDNGFTSEWLTSPSSSEAILGILAFVVWVAWAHFVVCLVVEAVAERRKRGMAPSVPGGGVGTQALARRAIAAIALIAGTAAVSVGPASAAIGPEATTTAGTHAVVAMQNSVAASAANAAQANSLADTVVRGALPGADQLLNATAQDVAEGVTTYYEVKPPEGRNYDTMWDIAERYLGSGVRYKEVWELNKHLTQADGRSLQDANLIHPGWVLKLPNEARGPGLKVVEHAAPAAAGSATGGDSATAAGATGGDAASTAAEGGAAEASGSLASSIFNENWTPFFGVAGGLALAGAFLGLRRRRGALGTRELWADAVRRSADRPDPTDPSDPGPGGPGTRLRDEADLGLASWLNQALRSFAGSLPAPARAWAGNSGLVLGFDQEPTVEPPAPWIGQGARTWALPREAAVSPAGRSALPGLVTVGGREDGSLAMVDPETVPGLIALTGDAAQGRGLAMSMAVDTATHPWADDRLVTLVGFADDLTGVGQGRIRRASDLGRVLEELENQARHQRQACRRAGVDDVREARRTAPDLIDWTYHLVLCSGIPNPDELARLSTLAADPQFSMGAVVVGEVADAAMSLATRADGALVAPLHGIEARTQALSVRAVRDLMALYEIEDQPRAATLDQLVSRIEAESFAPAASEATVRVGIMGPVTVTAPGPIESGREELLTELAAFVALHPDGVHANRISAAIWPRGVDAEVRDSTLGQLADWFGKTGDGHSVLIQDAGVWGLTPGALHLDWDAFRAALNGAADHPLDGEQHLRTALSMVRGEPFAQVPDRRYSWLETTPVVADIGLAIALTTMTCSELAIARDDVAAARETILRGLELMPVNEELWCSLLQLEARDNGGAGLRETADRMYTEIAAHGSALGVSSRTDALVEELVPGYRSRVA